MVQWGAEGKAERGLTYRQILAYYYGGLLPQLYAGPEDISVGVAVGLKSVVIQATGEVIVEGKDVGPGPWRVSGGKKLRIRHASAPPRYIGPARVIKSPKRITAGRRVAVMVSLPQLSVARLALRQGPSQILIGKPATFSAGLATLRARVPRVETGRYRLEVVVTNGIDIVTTRARTVRLKGVAATPSPSPAATPSVSSAPSPSSPLVAAPASDSGDRGPWLVPVAAMIAAVAVLGLLLALRRWRRAGRTS
jgi:hypothetical protein